MAVKIDWTERVKGMLKAELKRKGVTYSQLVEKLSQLGIEETEVNIRNKIARGGFTAVFFIQCLEAIGCHSVRLDED
jgi:3-mercaptopyruvate sulfurtransferase SseA